MEMRYCHSCVMPLTPESSGTSDTYCKYCSLPDGTLQPREVVKAGLVQFFLMIEPALAPDVAEVRAEHYLKAMPAWAGS